VAAAKRLRQQEPALEVVPIVGTHAEALARVRSWETPVWVLFIGSSIGNYEDSDAVNLLSSVAKVLRPGDALLLGTDSVKSTELLLPAYDDAQGVTAAFNLNLLTRINRELGGHFDTATFRHAVRWNPDASAVELFLESRRLQHVAIDALERVVTFEAGERIHTESSHKYTTARIDRLLERAGFEREQTFTDRQNWFGVHLARVSRAR
jgi:dimethylhistidine N-methyltransferase